MVLLRKKTKLGRVKPPNRGNEVTRRELKFGIDRLASSFSTAEPNEVCERALLRVYPFQCKRRKR